MSKAKSIATICVGVLALTAFVSGPASAADWKVNNTLLTGTAALANTAQVTENGKLTFGTTTVECTGSSLAGVSPQIASPNSGSASSLKFSGCKTVAGVCTLVGETISTEPITATAQAVAGTVLAVFKPKTKTTFATIEFTGATCAIGNEVAPITGTALVTAPNGATENTLQEILANTPSGELKVGSGGTAATLKGGAKLRLLSGSPWSFS